MPERADLVVAASPAEFFQAALAEAMARERVTVGPFTKQYLVQLLVQQVHHAFSIDEPLAYRYLASVSATHTERTRALRDVGDTALLICGLWPEVQLRPRHSLDLSYHMDMGRHAYSLLSRNAGGRAEMFGRDVFGELCDRFHDLVDALNELMAAYSLATDQSILHLYERWLQTGGRRVARTLAEKGVYVGACPKQNTPS